MAQKIFNIEEYNSLITDYNIINDGAIGNEKKAIKEKYNVSSNKSGDIKQEILKRIFELRNIKQSYDNTDLKYFIAGTNNGIPERYKNFKIAVQNESINFVQFIKDNYTKRCIDRKIDKYINYKYWGSLSSLDKYLLNIVKNCNTYIEETNPSEETSNIQKLTQIVACQMIEYKNNYLNIVKERASNFYKKIPTIIIKLESCIKESTEQDKIQKLISKISSLKAILRMFNTSDDYVNRKVEDASRAFDRDVADLSQRLYKKNININTIKISEIHTDPKLFEMIVSDENVRFYCRSIIAATYSDKVTEHLRFIITNC